MAIREIREEKRDKWRKKEFVETRVEKDRGVKGRE